MADFPIDLSEYDGSSSKQDAVEAGNLAATETIKAMAGTVPGSSNNNNNRDSETTSQAPPPKEHPLLPFPTKTSFDYQPEPLPDERWSIFRVPNHLREVDVDGVAYNPRFISIGPFHYNNSKPVDARKLRFLRRMLDRIRHQNQITQDALEEAMKSLEGKTRECYSEDFENIKSDEFVSMMLLDGCFIVELLRLSGKSYKKELADDPIFATRSLPLNLGRDLLMLENQLPLFVLQKLFDLTSSGKQETSLQSLALQFFEPLRVGKDSMANLNVKNSEYPHLLALFHSSFAPTRPHPPPTPNEKSSSTPTYRTFTGKGWVYSAKSLSHAGVSFRTKPGNVLDMEFNNKVLQIPTLFIDDSTSPVLRNLLVYEQYDRCASPYFSSLAVFLNNLVVTLEDMAILKQSGIIRAHCGDAELVNFLYSLTKELAFDMDYCHFGKIIQDIRAFYQTKMVTFRLFRQRTLKKIYKKIVPILMNITIIYVTTMISVYYNKA